MRVRTPADSVLLQERVYEIAGEGCGSIKIRENDHVVMIIIVA